MKNQTKFINCRGESLNRKAFGYHVMRGVGYHSLHLNINGMIANENKQATEPQQTQPMPQALIDGINKFMLWDEPDKLKFRLFNILHHAMSSNTVDDLPNMDRNEMFNDIRCIYDLIDIITITHTKQIEKN